MSEQVSNEIPNAPLESSHVAAAERPLTGSPSRSRNKIRARIVQIVAVVVLVLLLVLLWRFLGNQAATTNTRGAGRGEVVPVEVAAVTQQDVSLRFRQEREITAAMPFLRPLYFLLRAKPPNQCCR